jgi:HEAT repeat protein
VGLVKRTTASTMDERAPPRGLDELLGDLAGPTSAERRAAARELAAHPAAARPLCERLPHEADLSVREGILTALMRLASEQVVLGLIPYLDSEDVWLRNAVIEALPRMPDASRAALTARLVHPEVDVRILAVTTLAHLREEAVTARLVQVLADEPDVNVCAAALEAVAERGDRASIPALRALAVRFEGEPFVAFATAHAIARIEARSA